MNPMPLRTCSNCMHWWVEFPITTSGYVEAICREPKDERDQQFKRGSDKCSRWANAKG